MTSGKNSQPRVLVTGREIAPKWLGPLEIAGFHVDIEHEPLDRDVLFERLQGFSYYLYGGTEEADLLEYQHFKALAESGLRVIAFAGKGVEDFLRVGDAERAGVIVANTPGAVEPSVAEFTVLLITALLRSFSRHNRNWLGQSGFAAQVAQSSSSVIPLGVDLAETRVGILGLGDIGTLVARVLTRGYGATVLYSSRRRKEAVERELGISFAPAERLCEEVDVLTIHLANNVGAREFVASLPMEGVASNLLLVNTASQHLVDPRRLARLLEEGAVNAAAFDKIYTVKEIRESGLSAFLPDRLLVTNHAANATLGAWRRMTESAVANILDVADGREPRNRFR